jgi:hypothetical protein
MATPLKLIAVPEIDNWLNLVISFLDFTDFLEPILAVTDPVAVHGGSRG